MLEMQRIIKTKTVFSIQTQVLLKISEITVHSRTCGDTVVRYLPTFKTLLITLKQTLETAVYNRKYSTEEMQVQQYAFISPCYRTSIFPLCQLITSPVTRLVRWGHGGTCFSLQWLQSHWGSDRMRQKELSSEFNHRESIQTAFAPVRQLQLLRSRASSFNNLKGVINGIWQDNAGYFLSHVSAS